MHIKSIRSGECKCCKCMQSVHQRFKFCNGYFFTKDLDLWWTLCKVYPTEKTTPFSHHIANQFQRDFFMKQKCKYFNNMLSKLLSVFIDFILVL